MTDNPSTPAKSAPVTVPMLEFHRGQDYCCLMLPGQSTDNALLSSHYPDDEAATIVEEISRRSNAHDRIAKQNASRETALAACIDIMTIEQLAALAPLLRMQRGEPLAGDTRPRRHAVTSAAYWYKAAQDAAAEERLNIALQYLVTAYDHTQNALFALRAEYGLPSTDTILS